MKILFCTNTFTNISNGPTKFANFLYTMGNGKTGLEIHILTEDINAEGERLYKCKVGFLKRVLPLAPIYRMFTYYLKSRKLDKKYGFDFFVYNNAIFGLLHSLQNTNVIGMINDYNNQENISKGVFKYGKIRKNIFKYFELLSLIYSKLIIVNSDFLKTQFEMAYPNYSYKIRKLYKGIDLAEMTTLNNCNWSVQETPVIKILFVKNDFLTGGLEILSKALSIIQSHQFKVTVIGPDPKYFNQIQSYFTSKNVLIECIGKQKQEKVFEFMASHHIFCVPSLQEALGVANLEALNIGIPVVTSDAGGIPEALNYGYCGFLSKSGDENSLATALQKCMYDKEERIKKVKEGFQFVKKFRKDVMLGNLQKILNEAI